MTTPEIQTHVPLGISESHESRHDIPRQKYRKFYPAGKFYTGVEVFFRANMRCGRSRHEAVNACR